MVTRGTWSSVRDRAEWTGRRDAGRAHLKSARNALGVADKGYDGRLIVQGAILSAIAYADAVTIGVAFIRNVADHQRLPDTVRHALGNRVLKGELTRLSRLLKRKDDSAYGHRALTLADASAAIAQAEQFATWAEGELVAARGRRSKGLARLQVERWCEHGAASDDGRCSRNT